MFNQKEMLNQFEKFAKDTGVKSFRANGRSYTLSDDGTEIKCINGLIAEPVNLNLFFKDLIDCVGGLVEVLGFTFTYQNELYCDDIIRSYFYFFQDTSEFE